MDSMSAEEKTRSHIAKVQQYLAVFAALVLERARAHDHTKLEEPEKSAFEACTHKLSGLTYGSAEYKESLKELGPALAHHYSCNSHHPEFHEHGVNDMNLVDVVEMFCDWLAACQRHDTGSIEKSIIHNEERFNISHQLSTIMLNTTPIGDDEAIIKAIDLINNIPQVQDDCK